MGGIFMPKTISSTEAQAQFGSVVKWARENNDEVIVKLYGEPAVVLMPYAEYAKLEKLRQQETKRNALKALDAMRRQVQADNPELTAEEAYRLAGFSEDIIRETLESDSHLGATGSQ